MELWFKHSTDVDVFPEAEKASAMRYASQNSDTSILTGTLRALVLQSKVSWLKLKLRLMLML